jgi:hypothetical protein
MVKQVMLKNLLVMMIKNNNNNNSNRLIKNICLFVYNIFVLKLNCNNLKLIQNYNIIFFYLLNKYIIIKINYTFYE